MIIHQALPERDDALPPAIDRKRLRGLEIKLLTALSKSKCNSWEALELLITVSAAVAYQAADDKGAKLRALLQQFQVRMIGCVLQDDHDEALHGEEEHDHATD